MPESGQEREREFRCLEGLKGQLRYGLFYFYCIHGLLCLCDSFEPVSSVCLAKS